MERINGFIAAPFTPLKEDGSLIGCLGTNYIAFSNGLRRDLEVLVEMAAKAGKINKGVPTIEQLIQVNKT